MTISFEAQQRDPPVVWRLTGLAATIVAREIVRARGNFMATVVSDGQEE
jgi:hypothetical protein